MCPLLRPRRRLIEAGNCEEGAGWASSLSYAELGHPFPASVRTTDQITKYSDAAPIARDQLVVGDMIGFSHAPGGYVDHIGVYAGTDAAGHPIMVHAPDVGGVVEETRLDTPCWQGMT